MSWLFPLIWTFIWLIPKYNSLNVHQNWIVSEPTSTLQHSLNQNLIFSDFDGQFTLAGIFKLSKIPETGVHLASFEYFSQNYTEKKTFWSVSYNCSSKGNEFVRILLLTDQNKTLKSDDFLFVIPQNEWLFFAFSVDFKSEHLYFSLNNIANSLFAQWNYDLNFSSQILENQVILNLFSVSPSDSANSISNPEGKIGYFFYSFMYYQSPVYIILTLSLDKFSGFAIPFDFLPLKTNTVDLPLKLQVPQSADLFSKSLFIFQFSYFEPNPLNELLLFQLFGNTNQLIADTRLVCNGISDKCRLKLVLSLGVEKSVMSLNSFDIKVPVNCSISLNDIGNRTLVVFFMINNQFEMNTLQNITLNDGVSALLLNPAPSLQINYFEVFQNSVGFNSLALGSLGLFPEMINRNNCSIPRQLNSSDCLLCKPGFAKQNFSCFEFCPIDAQNKFGICYPRPLIPSQETRNSTISVIKISKNEFLISAANSTIERNLSCADVVTPKVENLTVLVDFNFTITTNANGTCSLKLFFNTSQTHNIVISVPGSSISHSFNENPVPNSSTEIISPKFGSTPSNVALSSSVYPFPWQNVYKNDYHSSNLYRLAIAAFFFFLLGIFFGVIGIIFRCFLCEWDPFFYHKVIQSFQIFYYISFWALYNSQMADSSNAYLQKLLQVSTNFHQIFNQAAINNGDVNDSRENDVYQLSFWGFRNNKLTNSFVLNFGLILLIQLIVLLIYLVFKIIHLIRTQRLRVQNAQTLSKNSRWYFNVETNQGSKSVIFLFEFKILLTVFAIFMIEMTVFVLNNFMTGQNSNSFWRFSLAFSIIYFVFILALLVLMFFIAYSYPNAGEWTVRRLSFLIKGLKQDLIRRLFHPIQYLHYFFFSLFLTTAFSVRLIQIIPNFLFLLLFFIYTCLRYPERRFDQLEQIIVHALLLFAKFFLLILVIDDSAEICSDWTRWNFGFLISIVTFIIILWNTCIIIFKFFSYFWDCCFVKRHLCFSNNLNVVGSSRSIQQIGETAGSDYQFSPNQFPRQSNKVEVMQLNNRLNVQSENISATTQKTELITKTSRVQSETPKIKTMNENDLNAQPRFAPDQEQSLHMLMDTAKENNQIERQSNNFEKGISSNVQPNFLTSDVISHESLQSVQEKNSNDIQFKSNLDALRNIGAKKHLNFQKKIPKKNEEKSNKEELNSDEEIAKIFWGEKSNRPK